MIVLPTKMSRNVFTTFVWDNIDLREKMLVVREPPTSLRVFGYGVRLVKSNSI